MSLTINTEINKEKKSVTFNESENKIYLLYKWNFAYREARNRNIYMEMALDRCRFRNRIKLLEDILNKILTIEHRYAIYKERFNLEY